MTSASTRCAESPRSRCSAGIPCSPSIPVPRAISARRRSPKSARSQFWFVAVHGAGAVAFFFVLSGFVLTRLSLTTGRTDILVRGLIKRWPRLAGPALIAVLGSWLLFAVDGYFYAPAAALSGSSWFRASAAR